MHPESESLEGGEKSAGGSRTPRNIYRPYETPTEGNTVLQAFMGGQGNTGSSESESGSSDQTSSQNLKKG